MSESNLSKSRKYPIGLIVFFFALFWFLFWGRGMAPTGDEKETLEVARGLFYAQRAERVGLAGERFDPAISKYGIGQSLVDLPGVALDSWIARIWPSAPLFIRLFTMQLPGVLEAALAAWFLFAIARLLGFGLKRSAAIALAAALTTPLWVYSRTIFGDLTVAAATLGAVWAALRYEVHGTRARDAALAGAFLALAAITKYGALISAPWFVLHLILVARKDEKLAYARLAAGLAGFLIPLLAGIAWLLWYNYWRFGRCFETGYWNSADEIFGFGTPLWTGLHGMFFSSGKSLFLYSPLLIAALFGWKRLFARRSASCVLIAGVILTGILFYALWWAWHGDWCWGNRHLLYATLLGLLPLGERGREKPAGGSRKIRWGLAGLVVLALLGLYVNLLGVLVWRCSPFYVSRDLMPTSVFKQSAFEKDVWEIRDDYVHFHFIPEFSPIKTHRWIAAEIWRFDQWEDPAAAGREIAAGAPWNKLNKDWSPEIAPDYMFTLFGSFDTWWHARWRQVEFSLSGPKDRWGSLETFLFAFFLLGVLGSGLWLRQSLAPSHADD